MVEENNKLNENAVKEEMVEETKSEVVETASDNLENKIEEPKKDVAKDKKTKAKEVKKVVVKELAVANGFSLKISPKKSYAICKVIKGKDPESAIKRLEDVLKMKRVIPMAGREVPHQRGIGLAGARFPKNACEAIIKVIKQLKANAVVAGIEDPVITIAMANRGSSPVRRGGVRGKSTNLHLEVRERKKMLEMRNGKKTGGEK